MAGLCAAVTGRWTIGGGRLTVVPSAPDYCLDAAGYPRAVSRVLAEKGRLVFAVATDELLIERGDVVLRFSRQ